jgi:hypothetical protein
MEPAYCKKWCKRNITELKNVLAYMKIDYEGRSLEWVEKTLTDYQAPDPLGKILRNIEEKNV